MASMPPRTTPLADPMAFMPPRTTPLLDPMASMPPMTTPLDPAGPLPSDIFTSAAALPTQLYSAGTFPASGTGPPGGFESAASMGTPAAVQQLPEKPSLWTSQPAGPGVMQSAPAPAVSPTFPTANPFATAGPKAQVE